MRQCEHHDEVHKYVDGALAPVESAALEAHLESCADCRATAADLNKLRGIFSAMPRALPSPALLDRVRRDMAAWTASDARAEKNRIITSMCRKIGVAAACISLLLGGLIFHHLSGAAVVSSTGNGVTAETTATKTSEDFYPFNTLSNSEKAFLKGDAAQAYGNFYNISEVTL